MVVVPEAMELLNSNKEKLSKKEQKKVKRGLLNTLFILSFKLG